MTFDEFVTLVFQQLTEVGFTCSTKDLDGPMGSARVRFSSDLIDVELYNDRGLLSVSAGRAGCPTYGCRMWAALLGADFDADSDANLQVEFLLGHLDEMVERVTRDPQVDERLRDLSWRLVKERLGLDPNTPRPVGH